MSYRTCVVTCFFVVLFFSGCKKDDLIVPQSNEFTNPLNSPQDHAIHGIFNTYKDQINTVGLTIGILKNDVVSFYGYGEMERNSGKVPQANTFFEIGSITKLFTAIATTDFLMSKGLTIDEPIQKYLPASIKKLEKEGKEITFRHLMTHSSGLPYMPDNFSLLNTVFNIDKAWRDYDSTKLFNCLSKVKLEHKPGSMWNYSNLAVGSLGYILQRHHQKTYEELIVDKIARPLGLLDTKKTLNAEELHRMAKGYEGSKEIDYWSDLNALDGAGVLRSTTRDLLEFARINLVIPTLPIGASIELCQQQAFKGKIKDKEDEITMGLGWVHLKYDDIEDVALFHNGGTGGFSTNLFLFKAKKTAFVIFFNSVPHSSEIGEKRQLFMQEIMKKVLYP